MSGAIVVIDYQNMHLTGHERFCPSGLARHESLIHPLHLANQALHARRLARLAKGLDATDVELRQVVAFRGLPGNSQQPDAYRRSQAQRSEWTRDPRVEVVLRPLRYRYDDDHRWHAQEKGVDVLAAIEVVKAVDAGTYDLVMLATHDTDLEPALEYGLRSAAVREGTLTMETTGWQGCKRIRVSGLSSWHTFMNGAAFVNARDRKVYR